MIGHTLKNKRYLISCATQKKERDTVYVRTIIMCHLSIIEQHEQTDHQNIPEKRRNSANINELI